MGVRCVHARRHGKTPDPGLPRVEVELESDERGRLLGHSPNFGVGFSARSSLVSWGMLELIFGAIGGCTGGGGILGFLGGGLVTGVVWGAFGLLAADGCPIHLHVKGHRLECLGEFPGVHGCARPGTCTPSTACLSDETSRGSQDATAWAGPGCWGSEN